MHRLLAAVATALLTVIVAACGSGSPGPTGGGTSPASLPPAPNGVPSDAASVQFCAQNIHPNCAPGTYVGPFVSLTPAGGYWDANGRPVNGGPVGADRSTGNNIVQEYCARNQDPACPAGSFVAPNAFKNPDGSNSFVTCEGTICTNPNYGGASPTGQWSPDGQPVDGGPTGADGSTGNNLSHEYCARNQDPACPVGSYVAPDAIENPDGSNSFVICEGTICTNPNHGGDSPDVDNGDDAGTNAGPDNVDDTPQGGFDGPALGEVPTFDEGN